MHTNEKSIYLFTVSADWAGPGGRAKAEKAQTACRLAIDAGYLPLAPHLYFTQMLNDDQLFERFLGMAYGSLWLDEADEMLVIGTELSDGMKQELEYARKKNIRVTMKKV